MGDDYITLSEAAQRTPGRPSAGTIWRWARRGILTRAGHTVRLQHVRVGGRVYTTDMWLQDFFREVAAQDLARWQHPNRVRRRERFEMHEEAAIKLEEAGL